MTAALLAAGAITSAYGQVQTAGDLLVNIDATGLAAGPVTSITNTGTAGGVFLATGGGASIPSSATIGGTKALVFDGGDYLQHMSAETDGVPLSAPPGITGPDPTRSIEVWALNPAIANEEAMVSWGHRGEPPGRNLSFNYGSDFRWGAIGSWGNRDIGWNNNGGAPAANKWHHLVYTYDGSTTRLYVDGQFQNGEFLGFGAIDTHPEPTILIGAQTEGDGVTVTGDLRFSGAIGRVRIHEEVLTAAQVLNNYNAEKAAFVDPIIPEPPVITPQRLTALPTHRWSFNNPTGDATDAVLEDSVGDADGVIKGAGATFSGSRLVLPGGPSSTTAYGDLPNNLLSSHSTNNGGTGKITIEGWVKVTGPRTWGRIFDFGSSGVVNNPTVEVEGPGGNGEGLDFLMLSAQFDTDVNNRRLQLRNDDPFGGGNLNIDNNTATFNTDYHFIVTWDEATGEIVHYENGRRVSSGRTDDAMSDINDINNWLGRSNYLGDQTGQLEFDEFRIYDVVLTPGEALGNTGAGPNEFNNHDFAPIFGLNPANTTVGEGQAVTFRAAVYGSSPLTVQWLRNGNVIPNATNLSYTIPKVALADNNADFSIRATSTVGGSPSVATSAVGRLTVVPPTDRLAKNPVHRYSFSEAAAEDATDLQFNDSIGTAHGFVRGFNGAFTGSRLTLGGGGSIDTAYGDLPDGLISSNGVANGGSGQVTVEAWVKVTGTRNWARIFDFGSSGAANVETAPIEGPGGAGIGLDYFMYSASRGTEANFRRLEVKNDDPLGGGISTADNGTSTFGADTHLVVTWDEATGKLTAYENGVQVSTLTVDDKMSEINDINNWLGRSQYGSDANMQGEFDEVRIYDTVLTARQVLGNFVAGPDIVNFQDMAPTIVTAPVSQTVPEGATVTFSVLARGATPMAIQWYRNGVPIAGAVDPTYTIPSTTLQDNNVTYTVSISNTVNGTPTTVTSPGALLTVQPYTVTLKHRYAFNETEGTIAEDSAGDQDAELFSSVFANGEAVLDGSGYVNLPNGIITGLGFDGTIELWFKNQQPAVWSRVFDFGASNGGEDVNNGGADYLYLTARNGEGIPQFAANFPGGDELMSFSPAPPGWIPPNDQTYVAISWMASKNIARMYLNGVLVATSTAPRPLSAMAGRDVNNWLGRSQFPDLLWIGSYDELRLSSGAMNAAQVLASFNAGPNSVPAGDPELTVQRNATTMTISWPAPSTGYVLESTPVLGTGAVWNEVDGVTQVGGNMQVSVPYEGQARFFRLKKAN